MENQLCCKNIRQWWTCLVESWSRSSIRPRNHAGHKKHASFMLVCPVWGRRKLEKAWRRMPADAKHGGALCKDWIRSWRFQGWSLRADLDEQQHHWWQKLMERFVLCFMAPWLWRMLQAHSMTCRSMDEEKEMERFGDNDVWIHGMEKTSRESMIMLTLIGIATLNLWLAVLPMRKRLTWPSTLKRPTARDL